jgi:hypothetical protein
MAKRVRYPVIAYGEWTQPRMRNFREQCCDCGLIHRLEFRIVDQRKVSRAPPRGLTIEFRTRRDDRATAAARRTFRFSQDECCLLDKLRSRAKPINGELIPARSSMG